MYAYIGENSRLNNQSEIVNTRRQLKSLLIKVKSWESNLCTRCFERSVNLLIKPMPNLFTSPLRRLHTTM